MYGIRIVYQWVIPHKLLLLDKVALDVIGIDTQNIDRVLEMYRYSAKESDGIYTETASFATDGRDRE